MKKIMFTMIVLAAGTMAFAQKKVGSALSPVYLYNNVEYKPHAFDKLMVVTGIDDPKWDNKVIEQFSKFNITTVSSHSLLTPVKKYTDEDVKRICQEYGVDGIITISRENITASLPALASARYPVKEADFTLTFYDLDQSLNVAVAKSHLRGKINRHIKYIASIFAENMKKEGIIN